MYIGVSNGGIESFFRITCVLELCRELGNLGLKVHLCKMVCLALKVWGLGDLRVSPFEGLIGGFNLGACLREFG
jgi:hypothetical protein